MCLIANHSTPFHCPKISTSIMVPEAQGSSARSQFRRTGEHPGGSSFPPSLATSSITCSLQPRPLSGSWTPPKLSNTLPQALPKPATPNVEQHITTPYTMRLPSCLCTAVVILWTTLACAAASSSKDYDESLLLRTLPGNSV